MGNPVNSELELSSAQQQHQPSPPLQEKGDGKGLFEVVQDGESASREAQDSPLLTSISRSDDDGSSEPLHRPNDDSAPYRTRAAGTMKNGNRMPEDEVKSILQQKASDMPETGGSGPAARAALWPVREEDITPDVIREMETKYAAFVRDDIYGTYGRGPWPILEKVLVGLALVTIVPIRLAFVMLVLVLYYCICKVCTLFRHPGEEDEGQENYVHLTGVRRRVIVFTGRWLARTILFGLGFYRIKVKQKTPDVMQRLDLGRGGEREEREDNEVLLGGSKGLPGAIVSNHISYLDILYHMSASFPSFVAKRSVAKLPLVGLMSKCMGCVYVQRESKTPNFKGVSGIVTERLRAAHASPNAPIFLLFPEGTTTNGDYLLPFKTGAFVAGTPVLPVILKYPYARFSPAWETMSGIRHILLLLCQAVNYLEVTRLPVYHPSAKEISDPRIYSNNVRTLMSTEGDLRRSDIGLQEKRVYHAALAGKVLSYKSSQKQD